MDGAVLPAKSHMYKKLSVGPPPTPNPHHPGQTDVGCRREAGLPFGGKKNEIGQGQQTLYKRPGPSSIWISPFYLSALSTSSPLHPGTYTHQMARPLPTVYFGDKSSGCVGMGCGSPLLTAL